MLRALIIDDEKPAREIIINYLSEYCEGVEVVGSAGTIKSAYRAILKYNPDLVFLDIELADGKGFELLQLFEKINFRIIFTTAFSEYAVKAFRVNAIDYLLKPIKIDELIAPVEKAVVPYSVTYNENVIRVLSSSPENVSAQPIMVIHSMKGSDILRIREIIMCKADGYCTEFHLTGKRKVVSSRNLKYHSEELEKHGFVRVHNSYTVNLTFVNRFTSQGEIELAEEHTAFLGDSYKKHFLSLLQKK